MSNLKISSCALRKKKDQREIRQNVRIGIALCCGTTEDFYFLLCLLMCFSSVFKNNELYYFKIPLLFLSLKKKDDTRKCIFLVEGKCILVSSY